MPSCFCKKRTVSNHEVVDEITAVSSDLMEPLLVLINLNLTDYFVNIIIYKS